MSLKRMIEKGTQLALAVMLAAGALLSAPAGPVSAATTFYVSRNGSNGDGRSWATAWNELSRINWSAVAAGDTILVDGGSVACPALGPGYNCGMVYNSALNVNKNGSSGAPITIRLASEAGRNGTVIIDGGITAWSRCAGYASEPAPPSTPNGAGTRRDGIELNDSRWLVIDGTKWGGIEVRNHERYGLSFENSQHVLARYLKLHHNTHPSDTTNGAVGVNQGWQSAYNTVARTEIFRNGQDAVRVAGDFFTLEESYIHDHYCNHPDGIQSFVPTGNSDIPDNAGEVRGLVVRRNIFDKIGMQTIFLGENDGGHNSWNIDVTIHDNLFLNNEYVLKSKHANSRNWNFYNNTIVNSSEFAVEYCCASPGARTPMTISNNIFLNVKPGNTAFYLPTGSGNTTFANNCLYSVGGRSGNVTESGTVTGDPLFINSSLGNYALASSSGCTGKGASITSLSHLQSLGGSAPPPVQPTNPPPQPTATATGLPPTLPPATVTMPPATATVAAPSGTNVTFAAVADAYVDAGARSANYGVSTILRTVSSPEQRSYLRFDVRGTAGQPITRAVLQVYANGSSSSGFQVQRVADNGWSETTVSSNNKPALSGVIASSGQHSGGAWVSVDVTSYITGDGLFSLALTTTSTKAVSYPSDEAGSNRPRLVVELGASAQAILPPPTHTSPPAATPTGAPPTATSGPTQVPPTLTSVAPVMPTTVALAPAADAYVDASRANRNYGSDAIVRTVSSPEQRTYLRFVVTGAAGRPITRAVLRIYANGSSSSGFQLQRVEDNGWSETAINYNNRPRTSGEFAASGAHSHAEWVTVDVTSYITGDGTYTLALLTGSDKAVSYPSREAPENQPQLVLTIGG